MMHAKFEGLEWLIKAAIVAIPVALILGVYELYRFITWVSTHLRWE